MELDLSPVDAPRFVRGVYLDLDEYNMFTHYLRSLDPANKSRDVGIYRNKRLKNYQYFVVLAFLFMLIASCNNSKPEKLLKVYSVQKATLYKSLHFNGIIRPLNENTLIAPNNGVVEKMHYSYGQYVKKNSTIFTLNSLELQRQYNETLTDFLKAKESYSMSRAKFRGTKELWKEGLVATNQYLNEKSDLNSAHIVMMQASEKLTDLFEKMEGGSAKELANLSFTEFTKVRIALAKKHNLIDIKSPSDGILLYPPKSHDSTASPISAGMAVKTDQVLGVIGNMHGIRVDIDIPEVDIHTIKIGMGAIIRTTALGHKELKGKIVSINAQAVSNAINSVPSFTAVVEVTSLHEEHQNLVKVGMSCEIELTVDSHDKLLIPIAALLLKNGESLVRVKNKEGKILTKPVVTGMVDVDKVAIDTGLVSGDMVVYE